MGTKPPPEYNEKGNAGWLPPEAVQFEAPAGSAIVPPPPIPGIRQMGPPLAFGWLWPSTSECLDGAQHMGGWGGWVGRYWEMTWALSNGRVGVGCGVEVGVGVSAVRVVVWWWWY